MAETSVLLLLASGASPAPKMDGVNRCVFDCEMDLHTSGAWAPTKSKADYGEYGTASVVCRFLRRLREIIALWQERPIDTVSY